MQRYVPYFLKLFVDAALLQLDTAALRAIPYPKMLTDRKYVFDFLY
jgi:hypothetical protein